MQVPDMALSLRQAGYRLTRPRLAILRVLADSDEGLSPDEIHQRAQQIHRELGLVTVYRTLEILGQLGLARRVHARRHCHEYARAQRQQHYLVCRRCDRLVEFPCDGLQELIEELGERTGYVIDAHMLQLTGLCPDCQVQEQGALRR